MAWKNQRTHHSVDIDLSDEFSCDQLLQGLINANWLSEAEAEAIQKRAATKEKASVIFAGSDADEIAEARSCIVRGQKIEALIHLERFLGREWSGRLA